MCYVTDHAVLRYLERVEGIDVEAVRKKLSLAAVDKASAFGCDTIVMGNGARLKLHGNVVATVLEPRKYKAKVHG